MKLAVLSDTHGRVETVRQALTLMDQRGAALIIHCGDIDDADTVYHFPATTHFVFGNCDSDRRGIRQAVEEIGAILHEPYGRLDIGGKTLGFIHGDDKRLMNDLEHGGKFDFLFYGHTHLALEHQTGKTRVINPGALHRARPKTFVLLDVKTGEMERIVVDESPTGGHDL